MSTRFSPDRRRLRLGLAVVGGLVFTLGLLTVFAPTATEASLQALEDELGNDYFVVAIVGFLALLILLGVLVATGRAGLDQATPPAPEGIYPVPRFGEEIDAFIAGEEFVGSGLAAASTGSTATDGSVGSTDSTGAGSGEGDTVESVRTALREVAVTTVMRHENCTYAEASERIEARTWTDDEVAGTFLADGETPTLSSRLRVAFGGDSPAAHAVQATAEEIARLDEEAMR